MFGPEDPAVVTTMLETLKHRGPDDGFVIAGDGFAIGTRRLSIVDVAGGRQPLTNEDGTVTAAQNGELYNFPETRDALVKRGPPACHENRHRDSAAPVGGIR
jgi:asparagine synthase (glutamine-hydrolysing)